MAEHPLLAKRRARSEIQAMLRERQAARNRRITRRLTISALVLTNLILARVLLWLVWG